MLIVGMEGNVEMSAPCALIFRFIVVPTGALKMQEYQTSLNCITNST